MVNCPAVAVGAAQMPTNVAVYRVHDALRERRQGIGRVRHRAEHRAAERTAARLGCRPSLSPRRSRSRCSGGAADRSHTVSAPTPNELPGLIVPSQRHRRLMKVAAVARALQREKHSGVKIDVAIQSGLVENPQQARRRDLVGLPGVEVASAPHAAYDAAGATGSPSTAACRKSNMHVPPLP